MSDPNADETEPTTPTWVKASVGVLLVVALVLVISMLAGVDHAPGRHGGSSDDAPMERTGTDARMPVHTGPPAGVTHP